MTAILNKDKFSLPELQLSGWGRFPKSTSYVQTIFSDEKLSELVKNSCSLKILARGQGRAYGDAALNKDNICIDFTNFDRFLNFNSDTGILHAEAGVTLEQILKTFIPQGWFLPVTPGTKYPTLGGSVACDVHGKSKHSIAYYVEKIYILLADGSYTTCSAKKNSDLFWATVGGMGLTGLIISVEIKLIPIESSYICYQGIKAKNLETVFKLFEESQNMPMTVAWIDCLARGENLGRSIMMRGRFAKKEELNTTQAKQPLKVVLKPKITIPFEFPNWTLNKLSVASFNTFYYGKHPSKVETMQDYDSFFYPLDSILRWNLIYGKSGMAQYQFLIPPKHSFEGIKEILSAIAETGKASFLAVLKKFDNIENLGFISFPTAGYFLALDFPIAQGDILKEMDKWDELVLKYNGRIYLAKDGRMQADTFNAMYPKLKQWKEVKQKYDPESIFSSDLGRRLGLSK